MDWLIKIGGSLFPEKAINLCEAVIALNDSLESPKKIVFICGGGGFANKIRNYNRDIHFSDTANHNSAIMCMDIVGTLLADKVNGLESVKSLDMIDLVLKQGKLPLLNPSALIESHDVLEHSWRVTSDSIAMYIAHPLRPNY